MGDPDEERLVLLADGIEEVVWLYDFHSGYCIQASDAVRPGAPELPSLEKARVRKEPLEHSDELPPLELAQDDRRVRLW